MTAQTTLPLDPCQKLIDAYRIARGGEKSRAWKKLRDARAKQLKAELRASTPKAKRAA